MPTTVDGDASPDQAPNPPRPKALAKKSYPAPLIQQGGELLRGEDPIAVGHQFADLVPVGVIGEHDADSVTPGSRREEWAAGGQQRLAFGGMSTQHQQRGGVAGRALLGYEQAKRTPADLERVRRRSGSCSWLVDAHRHLRQSEAQRANSLHGVCREFDGPCHGIYRCSLRTVRSARVSCRVEVSNRNLLGPLDLAVTRSSFTNAIPPSTQPILIWNTGLVTSALVDVFDRASCKGWVCVQGAGTSAEAAVSGDELVVAASVIKVLIAIAVESAFIDGRVDPAQPICLSAGRRTPGPVGFSLFEDDVTATSRDLVSAMLTISDNVATDALLDLVGIDTCNRLAGELGLADTVIVSNLAVMVDSIARDAGFVDWLAMTAWSEAGPSEVERAAVDARVRTSAALDPTQATRTTARDMCRLLRMIWDDHAGPARACAKVRTHMERQLTRHRLAAGFPPTYRVAAKSGGLLGVVRNEIGVVELPDGQRFYAAVFTRSTPEATEATVNAAIGNAAVTAVRRLAE